METESRATTSATTSAARRSGAVKEVGKLQVARDRRRAQQETVREDQEQQRRDPSNPNWEFQNKIWEYKEDLPMRPLVDGDPVSTGRITVCIRYASKYFYLS